METLLKILSLKRPHGGKNEIRVADEILCELPDLMVYNNEKGLPMAYLYTTDEKSKTLFVSHLDTVHSKDGLNPVEFDPELQWMWKTDGECLGADDGAGVWLLYEMARAGVPGTFLWTVGEERGGIGARWLADHAASYLSSFDRAISFDRRGTTSVITHQGMGRCCSDVFADALSSALNEDMTLMYLPDDTGVYTDTAEFIDIIPECTNISVGYYSEHSENEKLDIIHFQALAERVAKIDWDTLPTDRDPKEVITYDAYDYTSWGAWSRKGWGTTSVSADGWGDGGNTYHRLTDLDDDEWMREELRDALYDAMAGSKQWLIELLCESVYPEDPEMAEHFIDRNKLDETVLTQALQHSTVFDPDTVLAEIFDIAYRT